MTIKINRPCIAGILLLWLSVHAMGQEFTIFGARNLSMGRSGVASVTDVSAVYVNPAALARGDIRRLGLYVGASAQSPVDIDETVDIIDDIALTIQNLTPGNAAASVQRIRNDILSLDDDLVGTATAQGMFGLGLTKNFTLSYSERWTGDVLISVDRVNLSTIVTSPNFIAFNQTRGDGQLTRFQEAALTFAMSLFDDHVAIGVTGICGYATNYALNETIFQLALESTDGEIDWKDRIKGMRESTLYPDAIVGLQFNLFERKLVLGVTGSHLLSPAIERKDRSDYHIDPQARVALAWCPFYEEREETPKANGADGGDDQAPKEPVRRIVNPLTLTVGYDITENASLLEGGIDSQYIGGGIEYAPNGWFAVRAGVFSNLKKSEIGPTITAGLQLSALELGVAWGTKKAGSYPTDLRASAGLSFSF